MDYRHEWKHELNYADCMVLRQRLRAVMQPDPHAGPDGEYLVRSLYFDDADDTALREKLDGVNCREKFRIRYYNHDPCPIHLEKKSKRNSLGAKQAETLTAAEVQRLLCGDLRWMRDPSRALVYELYRKMITGGLHPKVIVDYKRAPFVYAPGNVRVTIDYDIRTGLQPERFLCSDCVTIPAGQPVYLLEVKWDAFLPGIIRDAVQLPNRRAAAFSKYAACRIYG